MSELKNEFNAMIENGISPLFELESYRDSSLVFIVELSATDEGIIFSFDRDGREVFFSGEVEQKSEFNFLYPFDSDQDLQWHLSEVLNELCDGFLTPNNL